MYFVDKVSSGGTTPVSLTVFSNKVFVLNAGTPNITGFTLTWTGDLDPIAGSTRSLPTGDQFGQVGFNNWGNWLVVTDKTASNILVFSVNYLGIRLSVPNLRHQQPPHPLVLLNSMSLAPSRWLRSTALILITLMAQ